MEEIVVEDEANLQQLISAEVAIPKLSAQVLPRAAHLLGEPGDASLLLCKFRFDEVSNVWCFVHKKRRESVFVYIRL